MTTTDTVTLPTSTLDVALALHAAGICVIPTKADGSKRPDLPSWTGYQKDRPLRSQVIGWFASDCPLGIVTGKVSGSLEMFELEGRVIGRLPEVEEAIEAAGLTNTWITLTSGWVEESPSGGRHWFYRLSGPVPGNTKIAMRLPTEEEPDDLTLAETRGEGGFVVVAPSGGTVHKSGKSYRLIAGGPDTVPTIDMDDRNALFAVFREVLHEGDAIPSTSSAPTKWDAPPLTDAEADALLTDGEIHPAYDEALRLIKPTGTDHEKHLLPATTAIARLSVLDQVPGGRAAAQKARETYSAGYGQKYEVAFDKALRRSIEHHAGERTTIRGSMFGTPLPTVTKDEAPMLQTSDGPVPMQTALDLAVEHEYRRLRAQQIAKERIAAEQVEPKPLPRKVSLADFLDEPDDDPQWRIDEVMPTGGNILLAAQYKAGKSTMVRNLIRSLADGESFLDAYPTKPARIVVIDNESDPRQWRRKLRAIGVQNLATVDLISLRGEVGSFNILNDGIRSQWADQIRGADVIIFDCLRPVLDALGISEDKDATLFTTAFDSLKKEAGVSESIVIHHMGHGGERARGSSSLLGWPDVNWTIVRQDEDPASPRFFKAFGRDVNVPETALNFDIEFDRLSLGNGNRKQAAATVLIPEVVAFLDANPGKEFSQNAIEAALQNDGHPQKAIRDAIKAAVEQGSVHKYQGPGRSSLHSLSAVRGEQVTR